MKIETTFLPIAAPEKGLIGFANIKLDNFINLNGIGVYKRLEEEGYRLTFPAKKLPNGTYKFYFRIVNPIIEKEIESAVEKEIKRLGLFAFKAKE